MASFHIKMEGEVKFFNSKKGYGFITDKTTGVDYFFHISGVLNNEQLEAGDQISFKTMTNPKKPQHEIAVMIDKKTGGK